MRERKALEKMGRSVEKKERPFPKHALVDGWEAALVEAIPHAFSGGHACVFVDAAGVRRYVGGDEWIKGAEEFEDYAGARGIVTSESPGREKIELFKSLFRGRTDIYAHGYAKKQGGVAYSPVCANERAHRCPRWSGANRGQKCAECSSREFVAPNDRALVAHFQGARDDFRDVMGLFVLVNECQTWLLAADCSLRVEGAEVSCDLEEALGWEG